MRPWLRAQAVADASLTPVRWWWPLAGSVERGLWLCLAMLLAVKSPATVKQGRRCLVAFRRPMTSSAQAAGLLVLRGAFRAVVLVRALRRFRRDAGWGLPLRRAKADRAPHQALRSTARYRRPWMARPARLPAARRHPACRRQNRVRPQVPRRRGGRPKQMPAMVRLRGAAVHADQRDRKCAPAAADGAAAQDGA